MLDEAIRSELLAMCDEDLRVRSSLSDKDELSLEYHPQMEAVHRQNAARLRTIVEAHGWPGRSLAGDDGAEAAWMILQHAVPEPAFQRGCLPLLEQAAAQHEIPMWQPAYLIDRIRFFEGRPQLYGTQFDWDDQGVLSLYETEDIANLDSRRAYVGLPPRPALENPERISLSELAQRRRQMQEWARSVGWRIGG
jgi:hypothetical protein